MGGGPRHRALAAPGRSPVRAGRGQQRHPGHAHGVGQVAGRDRHDVHGHGHRPARLLHRPHQGAGVREVLLPSRHLWARQRRNDHRRLAHQYGRAHHLLHGGDPGQPGASRGRGHGRGLCRHGRIPLLQRSGPRLGLAGTVAHAAAHPVHAHERHAGRYDRHLAGARAPHRSRRGDHRRRPAPRAALIRIRQDRSRGHGRTRATPGRLAAVYRPLLARRRAGERAGAGELRRGHQGAARGHQGSHQGRALHHGVWQDAQAPYLLRRGPSPCRVAAALPPAGREARPTGPAARHLRYRHPGRGHQRSHPHRAAHRPHQVRRLQAAPPAVARVPSDRRPRGALRLRYRRRGHRRGTRVRDRESQGRAQGHGRPQKDEEAQKEEAAGGLCHLEPGHLRPPDRERAGNPQAPHAHHQLHGAGRG